MNHMAKLVDSKSISIISNMYLEMRLDRADENGKIITVSRRIAVRDLERMIKRSLFLDTVYDNLIKEILLKQPEDTEK